MTTSALLIRSYHIFLFIAFFYSDMKEITSAINALFLHFCVSVCQVAKASSDLLHSGLSMATLPQVIPATCLMSSSHLFCGLPLFLFPFLGYHCVTILLYLSLPLIMWPAHFHFCLFTLRHTLLETVPVFDITKQHHYMDVVRSGHWAYSFETT